MEILSIISFFSISCDPSCTRHKEGKTAHLILSAENVPNAQFFRECNPQRMNSYQSLENALFPFRNTEAELAWLQ